MESLMVNGASMSGVIRNALLTQQWLATQLKEGRTIAVKEPDGRVRDIVHIGLSP
jgi:hypothetical protein